MDNKLRHIPEEEIPVKRAALAECYVQMGEVLGRLYSGNGDCVEDKKIYYGLLGEIRYENWALREDVSKRSLRKMFDGLWRMTVLDGPVKIRSTKLGHVLNVRELRDEKDDAWESFLSNNLEYSDVSN